MCIVFVSLLILSFIIFIMNLIDTQMNKLSMMIMSVWMSVSLDIICPGTTLFDDGFKLKYSSLIITITLRKCVLIGESCTKNWVNNY